MLEINSLDAGYGNTSVLEDINLSLQAGEILAVIGPNGAGKTTLIRAISGLIKIRGGDIKVAGRVINTLSVEQRAKLIAVVPQARELPSDFTVHDTVLMGRTPFVNLFGSLNQTDHRIARQAIDSTQLGLLEDRRVGELSGGEQQRVLLARALTQDPSLLLLDEPTTHLDFQHQSGILNLVRGMARDKNIAVMMVLHDLNVASIYADRVLLMVEGRVAAVGSPAEVITEDNLKRAYSTPVNIIAHPKYGTPLVLPDGKLS